MSKTKNIEEQISVSLLSGYDINESDILNVDNALDPKDKLKKCVESFLNDIENKKIEHINIESRSNETVIYILELFTIAMHELNPIDFEGNEPLNIEEMLKTTAFYIFMDLKSHRIPNLRFYI